MADEFRERQAGRRLRTVSFDEAADDGLAMMSDEASCPMHAAAHQQRLARLGEALQELPERQREAFVLSRFDGLTQDEVAARMQISRRMVVKHLARAIAYCEVRVHYATVAQMQQLHRPAADPAGLDKNNNSDSALDDRRPSSLPPDPLALHEAAAEWLVRRQDASWSAEDARAGCVAGRRAGAPTGVCAGVAHLAGSGASAPARAGFGCARRRARSRCAAIIASTRRPARLLAEAAGPAGFLQGLCCHLCGSRPEQRLRLVSLGQHPGYTLNVATDAGETRQLDLPDGSHVALNFNSTPRCATTRAAASWC